MQFMQYEICTFLDISSISGPVHYTVHNNVV